jgi:hypothetical protein
MHPQGAERRISLHNMDFISLFVLFVAIAVAISMFRRHISLGNSAGSWLAREDLAFGKDRVDQSRLTRPPRQFLIVVLPDGKVVNPRGI